ncbi:MAG: TolC family protein, partial [Parafilimonas sp.]
MKYRSYIIIVTIFLSLLLVIKSGAQENKTLTLNDAIDLSIKNSKQLKLSKARIDEAVAATKEASEAKLPDASISGSYLRVTKPDLKLKTSSSDSAGGFTSPSIKQALYGSANLSLPIYAGSKIKYGIESAKYLEQATRLDAQNDKQEVVLNTIAAYINLYKANIAAKLVEENLEQSRARDTDFINLEKNGLLARNDLLKAELETSNFELSLVDAQNNIQLATVNMDLMLGLPETTVLTLDSASISQPGD